MGLLVRLLWVTTIGLTALVHDLEVLHHIADEEIAIVFEYAFDVLVQVECVHLNKTIGFKRFCWLLFGRL